MTECNQESFAFAAHFSRSVVAQFDGARMTTDGGALLLRQADRKIGFERELAPVHMDVHMEATGSTRFTERYEVSPSVGPGKEVVNLQQDAS